MLNLTTGQGIDPIQLPQVEVKDYLFNYYSNPKTYTLAVIEQLRCISQGNNKSIIDFINKVELIEVNLPHQESEASQVSLLLSKFRPEIHFNLAVSNATYTTRAQLVSSAYKVKEALRIHHLHQYTATNPYYTNQPTFTPAPTFTLIPPISTSRPASLNTPTLSNRTPLQSSTSTALAKRPATKDIEPLQQRPQPSRNCFNYNKLGHFATSCLEPPKPHTSSAIHCYTCRQVDYIASYYPNTIYHCYNQKGHTAFQYVAIEANVARAAYPSSSTTALELHHFTIYTYIQINKQQTTVDGFINLGTNANLIRSSLFTALKTRRIQEIHPTPPLQAINRSPIPTLRASNIIIELSNSLSTKEKQRHHFIGAKFQRPQLILGLPQLEQVNLVIQQSIKEQQFPIYHYQLAVSAIYKQIRSTHTTAIVATYPAPITPSKEAPTTPPKGGTNTTLPKAYQDYTNIFLEEAARQAPIHLALEHYIKLKDSTPPPWGLIYPLSSVELETLKAYLEDAQKKGQIQPSTSPARAPILFIPKKESKLRLYINYYTLNQLTYKDHTPLPLISKILDHLASSTIFTKLDLQDAYHQIKIYSSNKQKTAFYTHYRHFKYLVMPFSLANASATFQAYINYTIVRLIDIIYIVYLDNILIYSHNTIEYKQYMHSILKRLYNQDLYANLEKYKFYTSSITFLRFVVNSNGITIELACVKAITQQPLLHSIYNIQVFLGFIGFYQRFIIQYSIIAAPLTNLFKGNTKRAVQLNLRAKVAFKQLVLKFTITPLLHHFHPEQPIHIITNFSRQGIRAVLLQLYIKRWHPIAFHLRKLTPTESHYNTANRELLAIINALHTQQHYIAYTQEPVTILTNHLNLQYLVTKKKLNAQQLHWIDNIAAYSLRIKYTLGKSNPANTLSQRPDLERDKDSASTVQKALQARLAEQLSLTGGSSAVEAPSKSCTEATQQVPNSQGQHYKSISRQPRLIVPEGYNCIVREGGSRSQAYSPTSAKIRVEALKQQSRSSKAVGCRPLAQERL